MVQHQGVFSHIGFFMFLGSADSRTGCQLQEIVMHQLLALEGVWIGGGAIGIILVVVVVVLLLRR